MVVILETMLGLHRQGAKNLISLDGRNTWRETAPRYLATFDSSAVLMRALAEFLHGREIRHLGMRGPMAAMAGAVMPLANRLPARLRQTLQARAGALEALPPEKVSSIRGERLSAWAASEYPQRRYPAVAIGSSNGAAVHLFAALGIPWLPQTFLLPIRRTLPPDAPEADLESMAPIGRALLAQNPDLALHQMYDGNQDRLMVRFMSYFRVKRRTLGPAYERFLRDTLASGGTIYLVECERRWPVTQVDARYVFQHGGVGGATEEEYLHGSERVEAYLARMGSPRPRWECPRADRLLPEAEWGFDPALRDDVLRFASAHGHPVKRIVFDDPEDLSPLVADFYRDAYRSRGLPGDALFAESFVLLEPYWTLRKGLVPFWMVFNTEPSRARLERYLADTEAYRDVHQTLFSHGVDSIGLPPIDRWREVATKGASERGDLLGVDAEAFPRDFAALVRFHRALRSLPADHALPRRIPLEAFERYLDEREGRYAVRLSDGFAS